MAAPVEGEWIVGDDTVIYDSNWVRLVTTDVTLPDGQRIDHHVVRMRAPAAGTLMIVDGSILMLYRHRFITDSWGWEIPAGGVDPGEPADAAAVREALEESGWEPLTVDPLCSFNPMNGLVDQPFHIFTSTDPVHRGAPTDVNEASRIEWVPIPEVRHLLASGGIPDGLTFGAIAFAFATGAIG